MTDRIAIYVLVDILLHIALNRTHWNCCPRQSGRRSFYNTFFHSYNR